MFKKGLLITVIVLVVVIGGCGLSRESEAKAKAKASIPESYEVVAETWVAKNSYVLELKHKNTGCHYSLTYSVYYYGGSPTQMHRLVDGVEVPYCD